MFTLKRTAFHVGRCSMNSQQRRAQNWNKSFIHIEHRAGAIEGEGLVN